MKKLLIAITIVASLVGCKKGENDPFLSFRGRDGRVIGVWTASSYSYSEKTVNNTASTSVTVNFDGSKYTTVKSPGAAVPDAGTYEVKIEIMKKGKLKYTVTRSEAGTSSTQTQEGTWSWVNSHKNKSMINLGFAGGSVLFNNYIAGGNYEVDQLKNKEIILKRSSKTSASSTGIAGSNSTFDSETTLTLTQ